MKISILYEDNHLIVVEKPVNIPVQQDNTNDLDLLSIIKADLKERYQKPGNVYLSLLHRLDRPVGGAIVFAKTSKAASRMSDLFRKQEVERSYLAIVRGEMKENQGRLIHYLWKDRQKNIVHIKDSSDKEAKKAILQYQILDKKEDMTLVAVNLETGRPHQIRVQLAAIGYPLYGDQKYGKHLNKVGEQIALWSHKLSFMHPVKKEMITVTSDPRRKYPWNRWVMLNKNEI